MPTLTMSPPARRRRLTSPFASAPLIALPLLIDASLLFRLNIHGYARYACRYMPIAGAMPVSLRRYVLCSDVSAILLLLQKDAERALCAIWRCRPRADGSQVSAVVMMRKPYVIRYGAAARAADAAVYPVDAMSRA